MKTANWAGQVRRLRLLATAGTALIAAASCNHKDLCFNHEEHALTYRQAIVADYEHEWEYTYMDGTDWERNWPALMPFGYGELRPVDPAGLRVLSFAPSGRTETFNLPPHGGEISLAAGSHSLLFYNNDTEYILFDALASYAEARATTRTRTRSSYIGSPYSDTRDDENTVNEPDMLYGQYLDSYLSVKSADVQQLSVTLKPLVFTYVVRCRIEHGLEYVALARGALAGMAHAVYLNSGRTAPDKATVLFDCTVDPEFGATAKVRSFGVPDFPNENYTRASDRYGLNVEVRLHNGRILTYDFDVTDQVVAQPHGGVITVEGITVPDEEGQAGSSGFDIRISDWGPYEDITMDF